MGRQKEEKKKKQKEEIKKPKNVRKERRKLKGDAKRAMRARQKAEANNRNLEWAVSR